jgi:hypothetical protein
MDYLGSQVTYVGGGTESLKSVLYGVEVGYNLLVVPPLSRDNSRFDFEDASGPP